MKVTRSFFLRGLSALEKYFRKPDLGFSFRLIEGSVVDIAKAYDNVIYPGVNGIEALVPDDDREIVYGCVDSLEELPVDPLNVAILLYNIYLKLLPWFPVSASTLFSLCCLKYTAATFPMFGALKEAKKSVMYLKQLAKLSSAR